MIVNPNAGKSRGAAVARESAALLSRAGLEIDMRFTGYPGHAVKLAEELDAKTAEAVVAVGGDGTLFEVLNGLSARGEAITVPVGQIPVGTGNSFIKDLGIERVEDAVQAIIDGKLIDVDVGEFTCDVGTYRFANLLGAGFVANVALRAAKFKMLGALSYVLGVFQELTVLKSTPARIIIDGTSYERDIIFVEICNSRYTGGNMLIAPGAGITDGVLDVVVVSKITRRKLLRLFPSIFKGAHVEDDSVEVIRGRSVRVETDTPLALNADGEILGHTPIEVSLSPGAVKMFGKIVDNQSL
jgi:YegS/Rv2252/BmrU family lipid kinase